MRALRFPSLSAIFAMLYSLALQPPSASAQMYFDYDATDGLTPTGDIITPVSWGGNFWQMLATPTVTAPTLFEIGYDAHFRTGGINLLNIPVGGVSVANLFQAVTGTQTEIGGPGVLRIIGTQIRNESGSSLTFGEDLSLSLMPETGDDIYFRAVNGEIIINGSLGGYANAQFLENGGIYLNGDNSGFANEMTIGGLVIAGHQNALGGSVVFEGGILKYAPGITTDFSGKFGAINGAMKIDTNGNDVTFATLLTGNGNTHKLGDGTLTLSGRSNISGNVYVEQGVLKVATGAVPAFGSTSTVIYVSDGATIDASGNTGPTIDSTTYRYRLDVQGSGVAGKAAIWSSTSATNLSMFSQINLLGPTTMGNVGRYDVVTTFNSGGHKLTIVAGNVTWWPSNSTLADMDIIGGSVTFQNSNVGTSGRILIKTLVNTWGPINYQNKAIELDGGRWTTGGGGEPGGWDTSSGLVTLHNNPENKIGPSDNRDLRIYGTVTGPGGFIKEGTRNLILASSTNNFEGNVTITAGAVQMSDGTTKGSLGLNTKTVTINGGALDLYGTNQTIGALNGAGGNVQNNSATLASTLTVGNGNANGSYAGVIRNNSGTGNILGLTKVGTGRQILTGVNTLTGDTTVEGGQLQIGSGVALASAARSGMGNVVVKNGATISGNGIVGALTKNTEIQSGGTLSVGNFDATGAQSLTVQGSLSLAAGSSLVMDVWNYNGGSVLTDKLIFGTDDLIDLNGVLVLNYQGNSATWVAGDTITLFDWSLVSGANRQVNFSNYLLNGFDDLGSGLEWDFSELATTGRMLIQIDTTAGALTWDPGASSGAQDGPGVWNTADTTWWNGNANQAFASGDSVIFGANSGAAGNVEIAAGGITAGHIGFEHAGSGSYTLAGPGSLSFVDNSWITANADAKIAATISGTNGFTKTGEGRLLLSGNNTHTGVTKLLQGTLEIGNTSAFGRGGAGSLVLSGGTLEYGRGIVMDYSSKLGALTGGVVTLDTNGNNITWATGLSGGGTLIKTGNGRLALLGNMPDFAGRIYVEQGILALGTGAAAAGSGAGVVLDGIEIANGATLDISGMVTSAFTNELITISGHGVGNLGAIMNNSGAKNVNRISLAGHATISSNARWDAESNFYANGYNVTKIGSADLPFEGGNSLNIGNLYVKQGIATFTGGNDMGLEDHTIYVNGLAGLTFYAGGSDSKRITLKGGYLTRTGGSASESANNVKTVLGGLKLEAGASEVRHGNSQLVFALGNIRRDTGATLNIAATHSIVYGASTGNPALATTTLANNAEGIIGGWLIYGGYSYAINSGATQIGSTTNVITGLAGADYAVNNFADPLKKNVDVSGLVTAPSGWTASTMRFNTSGASTLTLSGTNTLTNGGILVSSTVGAFTTTITGGTIRGSAALGELFVHQFNAGGKLIIDSVIADNNGATSLTTGGPGTVSLRQVNTYTGDTYINGNPGSGARGTVEVYNLKTSGFDNLGSTDNAIYFNNSILSYSNEMEDAEMSRAIHLLSGGGGAFIVSAADRTLRLTGKITGEALDVAEGEGHYWGQGRFIKDGNGTLEVTNANNDYTGETTVNGGILRVVGAGRLGDGKSRLTVNAAGTLELNGSTQHMGLLMGTAGGVIRNGAATDSVLHIGHDDATHVADNVHYGTGTGFAGSIQDGSGGGKVSLVKHGVGYQILSGASTYTGTTTVQGGFLQIGSGAGAGSTAARSGSGLHTVMNGATLAGNGIIGGSLVVQQGGVLSIGNHGQTAAQLLTVNGGIINEGAISFDLWTHASGANTIDQLRITGNQGPVNLGHVIVNNMMAAPNTWASGETIKLIDWTNHSAARSISELDISTLLLANEANTYWDTRRLTMDGVILVRDIVNGYIWDVNTGSPNAQDGAGTWNLSGTTWLNASNTNAAFVNGSDVWIGRNNGSADAKIEVNNTNGITVRDITFDRAGTSGSNAYYYNIAGGIGAANTLTLVNQAMITTAHELQEDFGTTISTTIAGADWSKAGAGRLILSGANTFTGILNVYQGVLDIRSTGALGTTAGRTIVSGGATLTVRGGLTIAEALELNGTGVNNSGALRNQAGSNIFSGAITLATDTLITNRADALNLSGVISGAGSLTIRSDFNTVEIILSGTGNNTYTGNTYVERGILRLNKSAGVNAIGGNTQVHVSGEAILRLDQNNQIADTSLVHLHDTAIFRVYGKQETVLGLQSTGGEGFVENNNAAEGLLTLNNSGVNHFSGIIRDTTGSGGALNLIKQGAGVQELSGANTYSGTTTVRGGVLRILGTLGQLEKTGGLSLQPGGIFEIYNTITENRSNRVNDEATISLSGGRFRFRNDGSNGSFSEYLGDVFVSGDSSVETSRAGVGGSSTLTLGSMTRAAHGTLNFSGEGLGLDQRNRVFINSLDIQLLDHGMMGGWATVDNEFASYGAHGVVALSNYLTTDQSTWSFRDNAKVNAGFALTSNRHVNSLNVQQTAATAIDLGGNQLRIESGGLLISGNYNTTISNGTLTAGTDGNSVADLYIHHNTDAASQLEISAAIADNGNGAVTLVKGGQGRLLLSGDNRNTGGLVLNEGTVVLNHANALWASEGALVVQSGTLDLNGYSISMGAMRSDAVATAGVITNNSATVATMTVGNGGESSDYYGVLRKGTAAMNLIKEGTGSLTLRGNNTIDGTIHINNGVLRVAHANALGETGVGKETFVKKGATLEIAAESTYYETIYLEGDGYQGQGALVVKDAALRGSADQVRLMNVVLNGDATINNYSKRVDFDQNFNAQGFAFTKLGPVDGSYSELTFEGGAGIINLGDLFVKGGKMIWGGSSSIGQSDKDLVVSSASAAEFYNVSLTQTKGIVLNGGTIRRTGSADSTVAGSLTARGGLQLNNGSSTVAHSNSLTKFHLGSVVRQKGGTLNVDNFATLATISTRNYLDRGIIGGWAVVGNTTWAVNNTNTDNGAVTGLGDAAYHTSNSADTWTSAHNVSLATNASPIAFGADTAINSLRFTGNNTLTIGKISSDDPDVITPYALTIETGGILATGTSVVVIKDGELRGRENEELFVHQNSTGTMTISSTIVNHGDATALVKTGSGRLVLSGANTYTGGTYINGTHGGGSWGTLEVNAISDVGVSSIGHSEGEDDNALHFNHGRLYFANSGETARNVYLYSGGAEFEIGNALTLSGSIIGESLKVVVDEMGVERVVEGFTPDVGTLRLVGGGELTFSGGTENTYRGNTFVNVGTLVLAKDDGVTAVAGNIFVATEGRLRWEGSNQLGESSVLNFSGAAEANLNGHDEIVGGLVSTSAAALILNEGASSTLGIQVNEDVKHVYAGMILGEFKLEKTGQGTQVLSGENIYFGGTHIKEGVLQFGDGAQTYTAYAGYGGIQIDAGATMVVNSASTDFWIEQDITGQGDFVQAGPGTTVFTDGYSHTLTGNTYVRAGSLVVNSTEVAAVRGQYFVTGGQLAGRGVVNGNTIVKESGSLHIGDPAENYLPGSLTINGDLTLQRSEASQPARLIFNVYDGEGIVFNDENLHTGGIAYAGSLSDYYTEDVLNSYLYNPAEMDQRNHDHLTVLGEFNLHAGAILMMNSLDYIFKEGDVFHLIDWNLLALGQNVDGNWNVNTELVLPDLAEGLNWDRSLFISHGIVTVIVPEPGRMILLMLGAAMWVFRRRRRPSLA